MLMKSSGFLRYTYSCLNNNSASVIKNRVSLGSHKATDDKDLDLNNVNSQKQTRLKLFFIRLSFVLAWLGFSAIIFVIAVLVDIIGQDQA